MSKMWRVDLSEVTAIISLDGDMARSKMVAGSIPRLSSIIFALLLVENTRIKVP